MVVRMSECPTWFLTSKISPPALFATETAVCIPKNLNECRNGLRGVPEFTRCMQRARCRSLDSTRSHRRSTFRLKTGSKTDQVYGLRVRPKPSATLTSVCGAALAGKVVESIIILPVPKSSELAVVWKRECLSRELAGRGACRKLIWNLDQSKGPSTSWVTHP